MNLKHKTVDKVKDSLEYNAPLSECHRVYQSPGFKVLLCDT
jgi:hypothetical protein